MIVPWKVLQQATGHTHSLEALWSQSFESTSTSRAAHRGLRLEAIIRVGGGLCLERSNLEPGKDVFLMDVFQCKMLWKCTRKL